MQSPTSFRALLVVDLIALGLCLGASAQAFSSPPATPWNLKVCLSYAPSNNTPCAYLSDNLVLRVENPTWPPPAEPSVVFEQSISPALARQMRAQALAAIRSIHKLARPAKVVVEDGFSGTVAVNSPAKDARAAFGGAGVGDGGPEFVKLVKLLRDTTHIAF
jgi:hypothetical protein